MGLLWCNLGKSSLLESISGVSLPRGENLVTRCPLQLELRGTDDGTAGAVISYVQADGDAYSADIELEDIDDEIQHATDSIAGKNKNIVDEVIRLQVFKPAAPDLTLIDLPGIVRMAIGKFKNDEV